MWRFEDIKNAIEDARYVEDGNVVFVDTNVWGDLLHFQQL